MVKRTFGNWATRLLRGGQKFTDAEHRLLLRIADARRYATHWIVAHRLGGGAFALAWCRERRPFFLGVGECEHA